MNSKIGYIGLGIVLWLLGVVFIRIFGPMFYDAGLKHVAWFALHFVIGAITVAAVARMTKRPRHAMLVPTAIIAVVAMLMDSVAVTLDTAGLTYIYADTLAHSGYAGATLLFAFWSAFFFALLWHKPREGDPR